jgi:hypothetical protein
MTNEPVQLEEQFFETSRAKLLRAAPCLHLFRAFRIALDARKLALGAAAAVLLVAGYRLIDLAPFAPGVTAGVAQTEGPWPWEESLPGMKDAGNELRQFTYEPLSRVLDTAFRGSHVLHPLQELIEAGRPLFRRGNTWADAADAWTRLLWTLVVWSLFGTAITRIAAVQFARHTSVGLRDSIHFAGRQFPSALGAPLLPLVFIGLFWLVCVIVGLIGRIPGIGEVLVGVFWFVPLVLGLAIAIIVLFITAGWPLMICTGGVEATDAFDGLSRSYDYLLTRPWYALGLALAAVAYGSIVVFFVACVAGLGVHVAEWATATGMGDEAVNRMTSESPGVGPVMAGFWLRVLAVLLWGFVYSFFWSSATIIYYLLRHSVDSEPLDKVFVEAAPKTGEELPLVGMAAAEKREGETKDEGTTDGGS